jgi:hypothetical protein
MNLVINMAWVTKIKISTSEDEQIFETGKDKIKTIKINIQFGVIQIQFDEDAEWNNKIIPIQNLKSIDYLHEYTKINPNIRDVF